MGCGPGAARDEEREQAFLEYKKKLESLTFYQLDLIVASAWYVVRTFEDGKSTIHHQVGALEVLKQHLQRHTR